MIIRKLTAGQMIPATERSTRGSAFSPLPAAVTAAVLVTASLQCAFILSSCSLVGAFQHGAVVTSTQQPATSFSSRVRRPTFLTLRRPAQTTTTAKERTCCTALHFSSVGGGNGASPPPPGNGGGKSKNPWDDFLDPTYQESENLRKAREMMSENSLPISFDEDNNKDNIKNKNSNNNNLDDRDEMVLDTESDDEEDDEPPEISTSSALAVGRNLVAPAGERGTFQRPSKELVARNPYIAVVSKLTPSELISKFSASAHPAVQNAVRNTILSLIGGLPKLAFDTTTITTGQRLASLMFQLQMTGYMFKNAEYRMSLSQSLSSMDSDDELLFGHTRQRLLTGDAPTTQNGNKEPLDPLAGKVKGKLRIRVGGARTTPADAGEAKQDESNTSGDTSSMETNTTTATTTTTTSSSTTTATATELEVDAAAYMSELRDEVSKLRDELMMTRQEKEEALRKDLLQYIRTLPEQELRSLTNTVSQDVLVAMKGLVNAVMAGIGDGGQSIGPDTVTEQSGEAMAQLCMWQLVIGYNLRTLEVREEMKKSLAAAAETKMNGKDDDEENGIADWIPGAFE